MLEVTGLHTGYGGMDVIHGIDLAVGAGEIVALVGANGAGKSTLVMTICGNPRARGGTIRHDGGDITHLPTFEIMRRRLAQSPEGQRIFSRMSVHENLLMDARGRRARWRRTWSGCSRCPLARRSGWRSAVARSRAASRRCWRSAVR